MKKSRVYRPKAGDLSYVAFSGDAISIHDLLLVTYGPSEEYDEIYALEFGVDGTVTSIKAAVSDYKVLYTEMIA